MPIGGFLSTGDSGGGGGAVGNTRYAQVSPTSDPSFAALLAQILQQTPQRENMTSLQDMITGGMNSPLLQSILGPALARLQAPQAQQRENLTESTRAAGGLRSSSYGQNYNKLQEQQGQQQNDLMGQVIQQVLGTLMTGQMQEQQNSFLPARSLTELLRSIAPSTVSGTVPQVSGGGGFTGSGAGGFSDTGFRARADQQMAGNNAPSYPGGGGGSSGQVGQIGGSQPAPVARPPQYVDPLGGGGGGWYDLGMGGGTQYLNSPAMTGWAPDREGDTPESIFADWTAEFERSRNTPAVQETVTEGWW